MSDSIFIDTNILIYAHDTAADQKHAHARALIKQFWQEETYPSISVQVLQEFHVNLVRKHHIPHDESRKFLRDYSLWNVVPMTTEIIENALEMEKRYQLSYWDAAIIAAAKSARCTELWSEDLQDRQKFGKLIVKNPFNL